MEAAAAHEKQKSDWNQLHTFNADLTHQLEKAASELQLRLDQLTQVRIALLVRVSSNRKT